MSFDYLPRELLERVLNIEDFPRVLVLDKWTCNSDGRQAIFCRKTLRSQRHHATFIDQGYCFNAGEGTFPDSPLRGANANNCVYERVMGWEAYEGDRDGLQRLVETLCYRRQTIRKSILEFRGSSRNPFPNWRDSPADCRHAIMNIGHERVRPGRKDCARFEYFVFRISPPVPQSRKR